MILKMSALQVILYFVWLLHLASRDCFPAHRSGHAYNRFKNPLSQHFLVCWQLLSVIYFTTNQFGGNICNPGFFLAYSHFRVFWKNGSELPQNKYFSS